MARKMHCKENNVMAMKNCTHIHGNKRKVFIFGYLSLYTDLKVKPYYDYSCYCHAIEGIIAPRTWVKIALTSLIQYNSRPLLIMQLYVNFTRYHATTYTNDINM